MKTKPKLVIIGESSVGKTALIKKWTRESFVPQELSPTYGNAYYENTVFVNDRNITVQIWDTAGQESYRSMTPFYLRDAVGALIVFDVTQVHTYEALNDWINIVRSSGINKYVIIGNKIDLVDERKIEYIEVQNRMLELGLNYFETSALTGHGVSEPFLSLLSLAIAPLPIVTNIRPNFANQNSAPLVNHTIQNNQSSRPNEVNTCC